jgi:nicotinamide-nucleotide amidase
MKSVSSVHAVIVTIGDELLIGQTIDTNSAWLARELNKIGIWVSRRVAVADDSDAIRKALDEESRNANLIIMTGGLGPTADDITKPFLCQYFNGRMIINEEVLAHVKQIFEKRNRPFLERNLKQAEVPDVCQVLFNEIGTAPGMWFEQDGKVYISLPGVPFEMEHIMEHVGLPRISEQFNTPAIAHRTVITAGMGESFIAERLVDFEAELPAYGSLAYLPGLGMVKLRLTLSGIDHDAINNEADRLFEILKNKVSDIAVTDTDEGIEVVLGRMLKERGLTLGLAESCTAGNIAAAVTSVPGSSAWFNGSVVSYAYEVKAKVLQVPQEVLDRTGAVSEETVYYMASNARTLLDTDIALSVSGILGPDGGTPDKPVGTVWMAVADANRVVTKKFNFHYKREQNTKMAVYAGLDFIRRFMLGLV